MDPHKRYVYSFVASVLGIAPEYFELEPYIIDTIFCELTRKVECEQSVRDQWGNWDWQYCAAQRRGQLYLPWLDNYIKNLRDELQKKYQLDKFEPLWPNGKNFAICLTHDVDEVTHCASWRRVIRPLWRNIRSSQANYQDIVYSIFVSLGRLYRRLGHWGKDELWHYEEWLELEDRYGFKSTFFFFPSDVTYPHPLDCTYHFNDIVYYKNRKMKVGKMMKEISEAGWEIGLHSSYCSATMLPLLIEQRSRLEDEVGQSVKSIRNHYLRYEAKITPRLQAMAGLQADSTQGFNRSIGFRAGTSFPYWCWDYEEDKALPVLEIPLHIMDVALFSSNGLEYDKYYATEHINQLMDEVQKVGGCLTLNWHPNYINNDIWMDVYKALLAEAAKRNAWGCSVGQLHNWWTKREKSINSVIK